MEIEKKDFLLHIVTFVAMVVLMVVFSYVIFSYHFDDIEEQYAIHNTHVLIHQIDDEVRVLSSSVSYLALYAQYQSMDTSIPEYEQIFSDEKLLNSHNTESLLIYDSSTGSLLFDHTTNDVNSPDDIESYITSYPEALSKCKDEGSLSGLVFFPDRTLVVAMGCFESGNVTNEDISIIVVSRTLDMNELGVMERGTNSFVVLEDRNPRSVINGRVTGQVAGNFSIGFFEGDAPAVSLQLDDIMDNPRKLLKVGTMGQTSGEGLEMISQLTFALLLLGAVGLFIHIGIAKKMTYAKFSRVIVELGNMEKSGDLSSRIAIDGNDEANWIANSINGMLDSLEEKEGKYHSLFEQSNDAIMIFGPNGSIIDTNGKTSELLGYEQSVLSEMDLTSLSPEGYSPTLLDIYENTINEGSGKSDVRLKLSSGRGIHADISSSVIERENGTVQVIIRDITEKKLSEEALLNAKIEADAANRSKSEFLANMSHELRTPLNSIIGFSDILILQSFETLNKKQERYLNNISNSGKHLLNLINDILDLSKIEAGMMGLDMEDIAVTELLDEVMRITSLLASRKGITLSSNVDTQLILIKAERNKVKQTLLNLLSNAIKFTPEKGSVAIEVKKHDKNVIFAVKDTGIGISEDDQEYLFHEFTQVDSAYNRKYEGTGLGLALVKKFVEMHGGKVWVESEPGNGSSFYFEIPIKQMN